MEGIMKGFTEKLLCQWDLITMAHLIDIEDRAGYRSVLCFFHYKSKKLKRGL